MKIFQRFEIGPLWFKIVDLLFINVLLGLNEMFAVSGREVMFSLVSPC